jgi:hypothetical protein
MDQRFKDRLDQNTLIEQYQAEIDRLLLESPELASFQREIEERLDKVGDLRTQEGRSNRAALMFSMLRDSFLKFRDGLEDYQKVLVHGIELQKSKTKLSVID